MLGGMTYMQWLHWRTYMKLEPFGEERMDFRFASVAKAVWNVQIAKWTKANTEPKFRDIEEFVLNFGDAPERLPPGPVKPADGGRGAFKTMVEYLKATGKRITK